MKRFLRIVLRIAGIIPYNLFYLLVFFYLLLFVIFEYIFEVKSFYSALHFFRDTQKEYKKYWENFFK